MFIQKTMSRVVAALLLLLGPASAGLECTLCKSAMEKVDESVLDVNATAVVESTCEKVPDILGARAKCVEEASAAVDDILNKTVATALDPETACECLGACDGGDRARAAVGSIECALCEAAVEATDAVLKLNATQAALEKLADEACEALGPLAGTCEKLFAGSIDGMVQCEVATALAPATFCAC